MHTSKFKRYLVIILFVYIPAHSMAWGLLGHRIVGQIADNYLTGKARKEVYKILGTESVAMSSNWADFIKSDPAYGYLSSWHYINIKGGLTQSQVEDFLIHDTATDAYTKVNFMVSELKKKDLSPQNKLLYLRMLIHIVGDLHQPLHTGREEDLGGNKIKVLWFNTPYNLHHVWDEELIHSQQLSYTEYVAAIDHPTKAERKAWMNEPISQWIYQSYQLAEKIYGDIKQPDQKLDYKYNFIYLAPLNLQLLRGGLHLAGLLNEIFG